MLFRSWARIINGQADVSDKCDVFVVDAGKKPSARENWSGKQLGQFATVAGEEMLTNP